MTANVLFTLFLVVAAIGCFIDREKDGNLGLMFWGPIILANIWATQMVSR